MNDKLYMNDWNLRSWKTKVALQQPIYPDEEKLSLELKKVIISFT